MIRNYDENALLESSGISLLFNLKLSVNSLDFYATLVSEVSFHHRLIAILIM